MMEDLSMVVLRSMMEDLSMVDPRSMEASPRHSHTNRCQCSLFYPTRSVFVRSVKICKIYGYRVAGVSGLRMTSEKVVARVTAKRWGRGGAPGAVLG